MLTEDYITTRLTDLAAERSVTIRYANESGSRAWGLASTNSDYDVRFVYQHPQEWYLRLDRPKDMIGPLMELDGELDMAGWDLRKVMSHLAGSNAGTIEWLYSPVTYFVEGEFLGTLRQLAVDYFQPGKVAAHYLGIARSARLAGYSIETEDWNLKKFFYFVRPLLAAEYVITKQEIPPVAFADLIDGLAHKEVKHELEALIEHKSGVGEDHRMQIPRVVADYFLSLRDLLREQHTTVLRKVIDPAPAHALFRKLIGY